MAGLAGMDEGGGGAGRGQGGGDLARDVAALAHAADHHLAGDALDQVEGGDEAVIEPRSESADTLGREVEHVLGAGAVVRGAVGQGGEEVSAAITARAMARSR